MAAPRRQLAAAIAIGPAGIAASTAAAAAPAAAAVAFARWNSVPPPLLSSVVAVCHRFSETWPFLWQ